MMWMVPGDPLYRSTTPPVPTGAMTMFGTVWPGTKFRFEATGSALPSPYTVTNPVPAGWVTVTFNATDETPEAGTPPAPVTCRCTVPRAGTAPAGAPVPFRVSSNRAGASDPNAPGAVGGPARVYPETSAMR